MRHRVAYSGIAISTVLNVFVVGLDLALGRYRVAALQSVVVAFCSVWVWVLPRLDDWLDAREAAARADQRTAEVICTEVQRLVAAGDLHIEASAPMPSRRMH